MPFDAEKFLNQTITTPLSTSTVPCPEGEYKAFVDDGDQAITFQEGGTDRNGNDLSPRMKVLFAITGDQLPNLQLKRDKVLVTWTAWLDVDGDTIDLREGKNVTLALWGKPLNQIDAPRTPLRMRGRGPGQTKVGQR